MTILICGVGGYMGWPLSMHLAATTNEDIVGIDNLNRRRWVEQGGSWSATPIASMEE